MKIIDFMKRFKMSGNATIEIVNVITKITTKIENSNIKEYAYDREHPLMKLKLNSFEVKDNHIIIYAE